MQLLSDRSYMLPPGICIICEGTPVEGIPVCDTQQDFISAFVHPLQGRKYVCRSCATAIGDVYGLVNSVRATQEVAAGRLAVRQLSSVIGYLEEVAAQLVPAANLVISKTAPTLEDREEVEVARIDDISEPEESPEEEQEAQEEFEAIQG